MGLLLNIFLNHTVSHLFFLSFRIREDCIYHLRFGGNRPVIIYSIKRFTSVLLGNKLRMHCCFSINKEDILCSELVNLFTSKCYSGVRFPNFESFCQIKIH